MKRADTTRLKARLGDSKIVRRSTAVYKKYERFVPVLSFAAGFLWDSLTLSRIDLITDNLIILSYILLAGLMILLINLIDDKVITSKQLLEYRDWYPPALQFFFGGLFSSYVVFYFQSATLSKNWLFLLLLVGIFVGNELIRDRLSNMRLQFAIYFLAAFSFFIFSIPILFKTMNTIIFLFSGLLSLIFVAAIAWAIYRLAPGKTFLQLKRIMATISALYILLNIFYFLEWIPPVPLSLKEAGIYHHVSRQGDVYTLRFEEGTWYNFWKSSDRVFHYSDGDTVFCFASVFAPTRLDKGVVHQWQKFDLHKDDWQTSDRLSYKITGGRDGGYRGYTFKKNITPGRWRVNVTTDDGHLLGRISFVIDSSDSISAGLKTIYK